MSLLATLTIARYERRQIRTLLSRVPVERRRLPRVSGLRWGRHLGTSAGASTIGADLGRWAWFCVWDDPARAASFTTGIVARSAPVEIATLTLQPVRSRGTWSGRAIEADAGAEVGGPVAVLTRARVRPAAWPAFRSAVPAADAALARAPGRLASIGVGEWPVLVQGTFSIWEDADALAAFARRDPDHAIAIRRTAAERWYAEELFARFAVVDADGTWDGRPAGTFTRCPPPPSTRPSAGS